LVNNALIGQRNWIFDRTFGAFNAGMAAAAMAPTRKPAFAALRFFF
jgi:hypothetical protein